MTKQETGLLARDNKETVKGWLVDNREALIRAFPSTIDTDRLIRTVTGAIAREPKLQRCSWTSLVGAVIQSGLIGLEPNSPLEEAYLIPYNGKVQLQISYKGWCTLAVRSGYVATIKAEVVYEKDEFDFQEGTGAFLRHKRSLEANRGAFVCAWARAVMTSGQEMFDIMSPSDIEKVKKCSQAAKFPDSIWDKWPDEQRKKTVIKRIRKTLPMSAEAAQAAYVERQQDFHGKIDYQDAIDTVGVEINDPEDADTQDNATAAEENDAGRSGADASKGAGQGSEGSEDTFCASFWTRCTKADISTESMIRYLRHEKIEPLDERKAAGILDDFEQFVSGYRAWEGSRI